MRRLASAQDSALPEERYELRMQSYPPHLYLNVYTAGRTGYWVGQARRNETVEMPHRWFFLTKPELQLAKLLWFEAALRC